jgi:hypothetical protein
MNLRHAAALALVGWYLMVPPSTGGKLDTKAPLPQWINEGAFDRADDCESRVQMERCQMQVPEQASNK